MYVQRYGCTYIQHSHTYSYVHTYVVSEHRESKEGVCNTQIISLCVHGGGGGGGVLLSSSGDLCVGKWHLSKWVSQMYFDCAGSKSSAEI